MVYNVLCVPCHSVDRWFPLSRRNFNMRNEVMFVFRDKLEFQAEMIQVYTLSQFLFYESHRPSLEITVRKEFNQRI